MNQALHILKKDVRHLWKEVLLMLGLSTVFALTHTRLTYPTWIPVFLFAVYLIARVVHDEPIPGENQFWLTRPYRRRSLLAAKLAFVLLCVNLPVFLSQLSIFLREGFPIAGNVAGILWSWFLLVFAVALPVVAVAAMTRGLVTFVLWTILITGIVGSILQNFVIDVSWPDRLEWIRYAVMMTVLIGVAVTVIGIQYASRRTFVSRWISAASVAVALLVAWYLPMPAAIAVQSAVSSESLDVSGVGLVVDSRPAISTDSTWANEGSIPVDIGLAFDRLPEDVEIEVHQLAVELQRPDGEVLQPQVRRNVRKRHGLDVQLLIPAGIRNEVVKVRGSIALTLWSPAEPQTVRPAPTPVEIRDNIYCKEGGQPSRLAAIRGYEPILTCRVPFRWPDVQISADIEDGRRRNRATHSPFPSGIDMNQKIEWVYWQDANTVAVPEIRFAFLEPAAHMYREFEARVELSDVVQP